MLACNMCDVRQSFAVLIVISMVGVEISQESLCPTCLTPRNHQARVRHSRILGRCVPGFDHDCPFLGTAVGRGNHGVSQNRLNKKQCIADGTLLLLSQGHFWPR